MRYITGFLALATCMQGAAPDAAIGVIQADGSLIPLARLDRGQWRTAAATPDVSGAWSLWTASAPPRAITTGSRKLVKTNCGANWTLATDVEPMPVPPNRCPIPRRGVASRGISQIVLEQVLPTHSPEEPPVYGALVPYFTELERKVRPAADTKRKINVRRMWKSRDVIGGRHLFYLEAERVENWSPNPSDPKCYVRSAFSGWLAKASGSPAQPLRGRVIETDCDYKTFTGERPVAFFETNGQAYVLSEVTGWESQSYSLFSVGPTFMKQLTIVDVRSPLFE